MQFNEAMPCEVLNTKYTMRLANVSDSKAILEIYAPYITDTAVSFETTVPSVDVFSLRIGEIAATYPFLVCEADGRIVGYAYASKHRERAAYLYDVDLSIYVLPEYHGTGIASNLYGCLFDLLGELGYKNAYAACTEPNTQSMGFHSKFGFTIIGTHRKTGYKFGQWYDVTWLEKTIAEHDEKPKTPLTISALSAEYLRQLFNWYASS